MEDKELKDKLQNVAIPSIKRMLEKEKEHLIYLKESKTKLAHIPLISNFLINNTAKFDTYTIDKMIKQSEDNLWLLEVRLKDYQDYLENM